MKTVFKWFMIIFLIFIIMVMSASFMCWSIHHIPVIKQIGISLGLYNLSPIEYFLGIVGYTVICYIVKGILFLCKLIINDIF